MMWQPCCGCIEGLLGFGVDFECVESGVYYDQLDQGDLRSAVMDTLQRTV